MNFFALLAQFFVKHSVHDLALLAFDITSGTFEGGILFFARKLKLKRLYLDISMVFMRIVPLILFLDGSIFSNTFSFASRRFLPPWLLHAINHTIFFDKTWRFIGQIGVDTSFFIIYNHHMFFNGVFR